MASIKDFNVQDLMHNIDFTVKIKQSKKFKIRLFIGLKLIKLAVFIIGMNLKVLEDS